MAELSPKTVTFINRQGQKEDRQIYSPGQLQGFTNAGFQVVSNPFDAEKVATTDSLAGTMTQQSTAPTQTNTVENFNEIVKPTTISSTEADGEYFDNQKWLQDEQTRLNEQIARRQKEQEDLIRQQYQAKEARLRQEQDEEMKSTDVLQFRLGRKDTMYGQAEMTDLAERQRGEISALQGEMNELISEMKRAVENDEYTKFRTLQTAYNERMDQQLKLKQEMRAQQAADLDTIFKTTQNQKLQQEILTNNANTYASALLSFDPITGEVIMPDTETLNLFSESSGIPLANLIQSARTQAIELSKLSAEDRLREQQILKAQRDLIPQFAQEYEYAKDNLGYTGSWQQFLQDKAISTTKGEDLSKLYTIDGQTYMKDPVTGAFVKPTLTQQQTSQKLQQGRDNIVSIDKLLNDPYLDRAIGPLSSRIPSFSGEKEAVDAAIDNLIANLALENLDKLKGPMSDRDIQFIKDASAGLRKDISEERFRQRLIEIKDKLVEGQNDVNYFAENASQNKILEFQMYAKELKNTFPGITPQEAFGLWREKNGGPKYEMGGEVAAKIESSFTPGTFGGQCGEFTHQIVDFPPMGDMFSEKCASVDKFGVRKQDWVPQIGDVVISDASDVSRTGQPLKYGHAAVVLSVNPDNTVTLIESNLKGDEKISIGRTISVNHPAIYGALRGNIKQKFLT